MIGWVIAFGTVFVVAALKYFWLDVAKWLNNTAANAVERVLGYDARKFMQRAVSRVTRMSNVLKNVTTVFTRKNGVFHKVTLQSSAPAYEQDAEVLKELNSVGELTNEFTYGSN